MKTTTKKVIAILLFMITIQSCNKEKQNDKNLEKIALNSEKALLVFPKDKEIDSMAISLEDKFFILNLKNTLINSSKATVWKSKDLRNFEREMLFAAMYLKNSGSCGECSGNYKLCGEGIPGGPFLQQSMDQKIGCATNYMWCLLINCNLNFLFKTSANLNTIISPKISKEDCINICEKEYDKRINICNHVSPQNKAKCLLNAEKFLKNCIEKCK